MGPRGSTSGKHLKSSHADHLNTPRLVADATGTTVWRWDQQEPFGDSVPDENPSGLGAFDLPLRFPGQRYDAETGLHYNMARNYWPDGGRYVEADPLGIATTWPSVPTTSLNNPYAYASGTPVSASDPFGLLANLVIPGFPSDLVPSRASSAVCAGSSQDCRWIKLWTRVGETCSRPPPTTELWEVQFSFNCFTFRELLVAKCYRGYPGGGPRN